MHGERKKPKPMHRVRIVDGEALRAVLQGVYERNGTHRKAAEWLGIEKHTFTKLLNGTVKHAMSFRTYASILEALGGRAAEHGRAPDPVLEFGVMPTDPEIEMASWRTGETAEEVMERLWNESNEKAMARSDLFDGFQRSVLTEDARFVWAQYETWLKAEVRRLRRKLRPVFPLLKKHEVYRDLLRGFLERVRGSPRLEPEDTRIEFGVLRALEPLSEAEVTWGVERSIQELHGEGDLEEYLRAALKCEEIMLRRERDFDRVRECPPPMGYGEWLAEGEEPAWEKDNPVPPEEVWESLSGENGEAEGEAD